MSRKNPLNLEVMDVQTTICRELDQAMQVLDDFMRDTASLSTIEQAARRLVSVIKSQGKIISCGNGGSHCDAMHFAEEMTGKYRHDRRSFPALCISNPAHLSCVGNDYGYEFVFSRYIEALGNAGDALVAISTSGNSPNIVQAVKAAKLKKMTVIVLSGMHGGKLKSLADIVLRVPHHGFADRVQEVHIKIIHILILLIEKLMEE